jgi:hypothetical protein
MKKIITILQSNVEPLIIEDQDDTELKEYIQNISNLLTSSTVAILETSESCHVIKPHKVVSISVTENGKPKRKYTKRKVVTDETNEVDLLKIEPPKENTQEDTITDG